MDQLTIHILENDINKLERISFEIDSCQMVIIRYLDKHMEDKDESAISSKPFKYFMSKLIHSEVEFALMKDFVQELYVPESIDRHNAFWTIDFGTQEMKITAN